MPLASFIIRGRNEADNLKTLFPILALQTEHDHEFIYIDNESGDDSIAVAKKYGARVISIAKGDFSYPKALNIGAEAAMGRFLIILSAHSFPPSSNWVSHGLRHFKDTRVAGVYGPTCAYKNSPFIEKIDKFPGSIAWRLRKYIPARIVRKTHMGVLGFTNAIIPKSLWELHHFDEKYAGGGEDGAWARYFIKKGYYFINDPHFAVYHGHHIRSIKELLKQRGVWSNLKNPKKFTRTDLSFRKDYDRYK